MCVCVYVCVFCVCVHACVCVCVFCVCVRACRTSRSSTGLVRGWVSSGSELRVGLGPGSGLVFAFVSCVLCIMSCLLCVVYYEL